MGQSLLIARPLSENGSGMEAHILGTEGATDILHGGITGRYCAKNHIVLTRGS